MAGYGMTANPGPDPGDEEMDSLYGQGEKEGEQPESVDQEEQEQTASTAMVPLKVLQAGPDDEVKVGDERVLTVVALHDTQAEVKYSKTPASEISGEGKGGAEGGADDYGKELDEMSKEG
jgi:hypothetical protein